MERSQIFRRAIIKFGIFNIYVVLFFILALGMMPRLLNYGAYFVASKSMEPTIKKGSLIMVEPIKFEDIKVNDILCFDNGKKDGCFTHRVVTIIYDKKAFITKGDYNDVNDPAVSYYNTVKGKVKYDIPVIGYISMIMNSKIGLTAVIILFVVWLSTEMEFYRLHRLKPQDKK